MTMPMPNEPEDLDNRNPYQFEVSDNPVIVSRKPIFGMTYWGAGFGIIGLQVVLIALVPFSSVLCIFGIAASTLALIRSFLFVRRCRVRESIGLSLPTIPNPVEFYLGSLGISMLGVIAMMIGFCATCFPIGFVAFSAGPMSPPTSNVLFGLVIVMSIVIGSAAAFGVIRLGLPKLKDSKPHFPNSDQV